MMISGLWQNFLSGDPSKGRLGIEFDRRRLEDRIRKVKDLLPLAEQIMRLEVGIGELLAFHSAVCEKADIEKIYHLKYDCIFLIQGILVQIPYLCLIYTGSSYPESAAT